MEFIIEIFEQKGLKNPAINFCPSRLENLEGHLKLVVIRSFSVCL
ncbi:hypothetical protein LEP1GSC068_3197 [Leptospira sp. Fiocruz LV3954]|nr:hypothetical protein LEP1GSC068_3197 [Leptospira sp. Fiocruz LV3954]EMI68314.1 hypothetical protein LEP1GSC076_3026 [Leptospira sp. Fiocruz LV4135]